MIQCEEVDTQTARSWPQRVPGLVCGIPLACVVLGLTALVANRRSAGAAEFFDPVLPAIALSFPVAGVLVASGRPWNRIVWLLCTGGFGAIGFLAEQYAVFALRTRPSGIPGGELAAWLGSWVWAPFYLGAFTLLPLLFPDGRLPSRRWRPLLWVVVATIIMTTFSAAFAPDNLTSPAVGNPLGVAGVPQLRAIGAAACLFVLAPLCVGALLARYRKSADVVRDQLKGVLLAVTFATAVPTAALMFAVAGMHVPLGLYQAAGVVSMLAVAGTVVSAAARHGLYGVALSRNDVLNRGLVTASLGSVVVVVYLGALTLSAALLPSQDRAVAPAVAIVAAGVLGHGLRGRVGTLVDRILYRRRDYDYAVLASLGERLRSTLGPDAVLPVIAETVGAALKLPYVGIAVGRGDQVSASATYGESREDAVVVPLVHQNEAVGRMTVAPRHAGGAFDDADRRLLDELAGQVSVVAYALCLTTDLQRSRERLVLAREEERLRLRRDLHDGLKPTLAGIGLGLDAVGNMLGRDPHSAGQLLGRLRSELDGASGDIRRLVHGLRPPALDELGLVGALRQHASRFQLSPTTPDVVLDAPTDLPPLPAAVEVAAYRIGQEALENVRTHAQAHCCEVCIRVVGDHLQLDITDDGTGLPPGARTGVGLLAMQERAAEVGGSCSVGPGPDRGTHVRAALPLAIP